MDRSSSARKEKKYLEGCWSFSGYESKTFWIDLTSTSQSSRKAGGISQSECKGWELGELVKQILVQGQEKMRYPAQGVRKKEKGTNSFFLHFLFYWGPACVGWRPPILGKAVCSLIHQFQMLISSRSTLTNMPRNNVESGHPVTPSGWHIMVTIAIFYWCSED